MNLRSSLQIVGMGALLASIAFPALAQSPQPSATDVMNQAGADGRFTFLVFYRENNDATNAMGQAVSQAIAKRPGAAVATYVSLSMPQDKLLVDRYGMSRAPMPATVAVAPNGALTGVFPSKVSEEQINAAFVTRSMAECMKALQAGKLVILCAVAQPALPFPQGVVDFQHDPQFRERTVVIPLPVSDPQEADLVRDLQVNPQNPAAPTTVFMAPPGVLVGKFTLGASKDELAAALHKAGKCCDDPHCKHAKPVLKNR